MTVRIESDLTQVPAVTVVIPTLVAGETLVRCVESLERQTFPDREVIVVDNSGAGLARQAVGGHRVRILENERNVGFGTAINQAARESSAPWLAVLNDDAVADPGWLEAMMTAVEPRPDVGMVACRILLQGSGTLDSAGLLLCADGTAKQRGHGEPVTTYPRKQEVLLPSGCAALYRREMFDEVGGFDDRFFLYGEDTDLALRARWKAWECLYVPNAVVEHRYSHSAGRASALKAFYVERNRLFLAVKLLPLPMLLRMPFVSFVRYFWHFVYAVAGRGKAAEFRRTEGSAGMLTTVVRAWLAMLGGIRPLLADRGAIRRTRRLTPKQFTRILRRYTISARRVAAQ
jgi:GT2 family glycosyltransferase